MGKNNDGRVGGATDEEPSSVVKGARDSRPEERRRGVGGRPGPQLEACSLHTPGAAASCGPCPRPCGALAPPRRRRPDLGKPGWARGRARTQGASGTDPWGFLGPPHLGYSRPPGTHRRGGHLTTVPGQIIAWRLGTGKAQGWRH